MTQLDYKWLQLHKLLADKMTGSKSLSAGLLTHDDDDDDGDEDDGIKTTTFEKVETTALPSRAVF